MKLDSCFLFLELPFSSVFDGAVVVGEDLIELFGFGVEGEGLDLGLVSYHRCFIALALFHWVTKSWTLVKH